jgi:ADP-heptose:LPS heptosyltransferase
MPDLLIRIKKKTDGAAALSCTRADGSVTWQRQEGTQGRFFPIHDLTHYAVETVLGHRRGFYGLVAEGWDLTDFGAPWPKGRLPADMDPSELIVGFLDTERAGGVEWTAEDFTEKAALYSAQHGLPGAFHISSEQLARVRARVRELTARWRALPAGDTLELPFDRALPDTLHPPAEPAP